MSVMVKKIPKYLFRTFVGFLIASGALLWIFFFFLHLQTSYSAENTVPNAFCVASTILLISGILILHGDSNGSGDPF